MRRSRYVLLMMIALYAGPAWPADLQWMIQVEENIPADIRVDRIYEEQGQIVVKGVAPGYREVANYMRHIETRGVGVAQLDQVSPAGKASAFTIRISKTAR